jgi:acyl-CoA synthetase (AMP-forming)/AMP-acid ligase II
MSEKYILKELCRYHRGTFADIIYRNALLHPNDEAFVDGSQRITFARFNERVNSLVSSLASLGLKKGDVLGVLSWNRLEYPEVYGAAMKGGFIISPYNPRLQGEELDFLIHYSEAKTLFIGPELISVINRLKPRLSNIKHYIAFEGPVPGMLSYDDLLKSHSNAEPDSEVNRDDPFLIFYTSGTTGVPRGSLYTHIRKINNTYIKALELGAKPEDRHLMILPFFHIGGDSHVWPFFLVGGCNIIMPQRSFDPASVLETIEEEKATDMQIVPTQLNYLLTCPNLDKYDLTCLKRIYYAASPMPLELLKKGLEVFGPIFSQGYGQTESGPQLSSLPRKAHQVLDRSEEEQKVLSSCGQPSLGVHMRVVDEKGIDLPPGQVGEIIAQSDSVMVGYWNEPEATEQAIIDGWLYTGDLGYYDERGFVYIVDRKKDMIVTGGENVYSREVEELLYTHPDVLEVAVIGIPDPLWVESVHAVIAPNKKDRTTEDDIIAFCKNHLASYKAPRSVEFVDSLPKNAQGKILKKEIRAKYWIKE